MAWRDWNHEHQASRFGRRGNGAAVGQRVPGHHRRGPRARARGPGRGPAGGRVGRAGAGRPVDGRAGESRADGCSPAQTGGPAADRAVRAGRDDRVPAAAQRRGTGGARGHGQPAGGDRAGVRQPAGGGVPGRAGYPAAPGQHRASQHWAGRTGQPALGRPALGRQRGGAGRHRADRRLARARLRGVGADRAGRGGAPGDLPHRAKAAAGPVHRLRGDRLRHVGRHRVCPPVDRVAAAGPVGARGARGRGGHRLGGLPRPGAVRGRVRAVGLRHGADGRRAGHGQPVPGARRRDRNLAGLAGPGPGAGRADRRGDRAGRSAAGQRRGLRRRGG